jgi:putative tryptophan/tyrosine transport system substrate-binding protein
MSPNVQRREFIKLLGGAAAAWPLAARAQQPAMLVIGFLSSASREPFEHLVTAFRQGLGETGYLEGRNVAIEYRWADNQYDRLPIMAAELIGRRVAVIVASGGNIAALAAKNATATVPIVFTAVADAVEGGLVASLNRPRGNLTGISAVTAELDAKRLELLRELVPSAAVIGALVNPNRPNIHLQLRDVEAGAQRINRQLIVLSAGTERDVDTAIASFVQHRIGALLVTADPFFSNRRAQLVTLLAHHSIPAIFQWRDFAADGGLMSYGPSLTESYHHAGIYAGRILKGEKPADLAVQRPTKFELVINLKTAKALGLTVPPALLLAANVVIE